MRSRHASASAAVQVVVDALPLFEATTNFTSALNTFAEHEYATQDAVSAAAPAIGAASAVISAAAMASVASTPVAAPAVALAAGHRIRRSVDLAPIGMTVQA